MQTALMYHDVVPAELADTSGFPGRDAALYKVAPRQFEAHLRTITSRVGPSDLVLTFDDGGFSALTAADAMERHGLYGRFFITVNYIGTRGFMSESHLRELVQRGHVVGSHSCSHPLRIGHCSWPQLLDEWSRSKSVLSDILGEAVCSASVPGGDFAPQVAESAAETGFTELFTSEPTAERRQAFGLTLVGRFTILRRTSAAAAAALAAGEWLPCARQAVLWKAKKMTKRVGGARYLQLRRAILGGTDVRWGDQH
jgi:peptidoglycan/xylan/chitin deacetylase (PgdA/CDA1 family)